MTLPSSLAPYGDILCTCGNTPGSDGFTYIENGRYTCETPSCGLVHDYDALEREKDAHPWRAGVLEALRESWERLDVRETVQGVLWDDPHVSPADLASRVAAAMQRLHTDMADESDGREADRERVASETWRIPNHVPTAELNIVAWDLAGLNHDHTLTTTTGE